MAVRRSNTAAPRSATWPMACAGAGEAAHRCRHAGPDQEAVDGRVDLPSMAPSWDPQGGLRRAPIQGECAPGWQGGQALPGSYAASTTAGGVSWAMQASTAPRREVVVWSTSMTVLRRSSWPSVTSACHRPTRVGTPGARPLRRRMR